MAILCEKPIADTLDAAREIHRAVKSGNVPMVVSQNYRFTPRMLAFRRVLREGGLGCINYIVARFAADYRKFGSWGRFRHEIEHPLLIEGAIHHFDMMRNLAGADCETISGCEWNPPWSNFKGESSALFVMKMTNGVFCFYEGNCSEASRQNSWHEEYYRAECQKAAVEIKEKGPVRIPRAGKRPEEVSLPSSVPLTGQEAIVQSFLAWLDGGPPSQTSLDDNIKSFAILFAAMDASRESSVKKVDDYVGLIRG